MRGRAICVLSILLAFVFGSTPGFALAAPSDEESESAPSDPDFVAGRQAIESRDWSTAVRRLSSASLRDTRNADIQNWLGFAHRNMGNLDAAFKHYGRALELNPRHRGAHEYVGEAYLMVGRLADAERHLAELARICLIPCEEHDDLKQKIAEYQQKRAGK